MSEINRTDPRITPEVAEKLAQVDLGLEAQQFLNSRVGRYLVKRAEHEVEQGVQSLKTMDPRDPLAVIRVQSDVARAESFMYWMAEIINAGTEVTNQLIAQERQDLGIEDGAPEGDATGS
jgi:hypothetical protein